VPPIWPAPIKAILLRAMGTSELSLSMRRRRVDRGAG
jgi:hypothetical protein